MQLNYGATHCESLNAKQILPRSRQESDDLVSALLSLNLDLENGNVRVSIDIHKTKEGEWHDSAGQPISYFNWLPDEPDDLSGNRNFAGFQIDKVNRSAKWADYSSADELNVVCTNIAGQGENNRLKNNWEQSIDLHGVITELSVQQL